MFFPCLKYYQVCHHAHSDIYLVGRYVSVMFSVLCDAFIFMQMVSQRVSQLGEAAILRVPIRDFPLFKI